jgi:molybdate transport system ATP-binding protein
MVSDMLAVDVEKRLGAFEVNAVFQGDSGVTALFGPSGSGKTSIVGRAHCPAASASASRSAARC